jgi:hypothetical protein
MKRTRWYCQVAVALACVGTIVPERVIAATPAAPQPLIRDVALGTNSTFSGQVVDSQGLPQAGTDVTVWQSDTKVAAAKTDADGRFAIAGLRSGVHQVAAGQAVNVYRFWAPKTAPPAAGNEVLIVGDQPVTRGNFGGGFVRFFTNPWVLAGIVAAAIAIPIALNNDDDSGS